MSTEEGVKMANDSCCEYCLNFEYDDELDCDVCTVDMDMDEVDSLAMSNYKTCPYYRVNNEYKIVEKQN